MRKLDLDVLLMSLVMFVICNIMFMWHTGMLMGLLVIYVFMGIPGRVNAFVLGGRLYCYMHFMMLLLYLLGALFSTISFYFWVPFIGVSILIVLSFLTNILIKTWYKSINFSIWCSLHLGCLLVLWTTRHSSELQSVFKRYICILFSPFFFTAIKLIYT